MHSIYFKLKIIYYDYNSLQVQLKFLFKEDIVRHWANQISVCSYGLKM